MSIFTRRRRPAPHMFGSWAEALICTIAIAAAMVALAVLHIEFPNGLTDMHIALIAAKP